MTTSRGAQNCPLGDLFPMKALSGHQEATAKQPAPIALFRAEAVKAKSGDWLGEVVIVQPASTSLLAGVAFLIGSALIAFCVFGEYTKKARVSGYVVPDRGLLKVYAEQAGQITALNISEGDKVRRGDVLAAISSEKVNSNGATQDFILRQMQVRERSLEAEIEKSAELFRQQEASLKARLTRIVDELAQLNATARLQRESMEAAQVTFERTAQLQAAGYLSEVALQEKRLALLDQRQRLSELLRAHTALEREKLTLELEADSIPLRRDNAIEALRRSQSELRAAATETETRREERLTAPQDGTVSGLQLHLGKQVLPGNALFSIIPANTRLQVDLYVPSRDVGFVRPGATVRLQYQAFAYQKFGTYEAQVLRVSRTALPASDLPFPAPTGELFYIVSAIPASQTVKAYNRDEPIQSGMQVNADI